MKNVHIIILYQIDMETNDSKMSNLFWSLLYCVVNNAESILSFSPPVYYFWPLAPFPATLHLATVTVLCILLKAKYFIVCFLCLLFL